MQVEHSFCIPIYNRYTVVDETRILHPLDTLISGILKQKLKSFELIVVDFGSTDTNFSWLRDVCSQTILITLREPFNLGRGRNVSATIATGKRLYMLDCDMEIPQNFVATIQKDIDSKHVVFPIYNLTHKDGKLAKEGQGWGNVCMLKTVFNQLVRDGVSWQEKTIYGGEDTSYANPIVKHNKAKYKRYLVPGFNHIWHPKINNEWYNTLEKKEVKNAITTIAE